MAGLMKTKNKAIYNAVNLLVMLVTIGFFAYDCRNITGIIAGVSPLVFAMLAATVMLVHVTKAMRLYLALYGLGVGMPAHLKAYCKTTPVSMVIPFKLGELFRMFCYGSLLGNALSGIVIILLDRFMDTVALIAIILFAGLMLSWRMQPFIYFLMAFLAFALIAYHAFPRVRDFWKRYLLSATATEGRLRLLRFLEGLDGIYREIEGVVRGRGIILFFISLLAWVVEIGSLYAMNMLAGSGGTERVIYGYLESAIGGRQTVELRRFVVASVAFLLCMYVAVKVRELATKRGKRS